MNTAPLPEFREIIRIGSHFEYSKWNHETQSKEISPIPAKGFSQNIITDYATVYHDCLPGKEWLQLHWHDVYPEPTIDILIDGNVTHFNGDYKKGMVKDLLALYTTKVRIGRRCVTLDVGEADRIKPIELKEESVT